MSSSDTFLFSDYWPKPNEGELYRIDYGVTAGLHLSSIFSYHDGNIWYQDDYTDDKWTATWVNKYHYTNNGEDIGIIEIADWYPSTTWINKLFGKIKVTGFWPGYEIPWGGVQKVGDVIDKKLMISPFHSTPLAWFTSGRQVVKFVGRYDSMTLIDKSATYNDVIEITYDQSFASKTAGARYWYARGVGIIQMQWRGNSADVGDILPCTNKVLKGYIDADRNPVYT